MNVYDFDHTLYDGDSSVDFYRYALRNCPALIRYLPGQLWGFLLYGVKAIDKTELKERFFRFVKGMDAEALAETFWEKHQKKVFDWYSRQHQPQDVIISASPEFLLRPVCRRLGVSCLIASVVDPHTGKFQGANCRGEEKVKRLTRECPGEPVDCFYSDSISDLPLARMADKAFLVQKGRILNWNMD